MTAAIRAASAYTLPAAEVPGALVGELITFRTALAHGVPAVIGPVELRQVYATAVEVILYVCDPASTTGDLAEFTLIPSDQVEVLP